MEKAILVAGDGDFEPIVTAVADMGVIVEVVADPNTRNVELTNSADRFRPLTFHDYWNWSLEGLKNQFPIPRHGNSGCLALR
jgi:hypothetical protein